MATTTLERRPRGRRQIFGNTSSESPPGKFSLPGKLALELESSNRYKSAKKGEVALQ